MSNILALTDGEKRYDLLGTVTSQWVRRNPEAAAAYVVNLPVDSYRGPLIQGVVADWARNDGAAAWAWVQSLPESETRIRSMCMH